MKCGEAIEGSAVVDWARGREGTAMPWGRMVRRRLSVLGKNITDMICIPGMYTVPSTADVGRALGSYYRAAALAARSFYFTCVPVYPEISSDLFVLIRITKRSLHLRKERYEYNEGERTRFDVASCEHPLE